LVAYKKKNSRAAAFAAGYDAYLADNALRHVGVAQLECAHVPDFGTFAS
jgi:hypothetical protein